MVRKLVTAAAALAAVAGLAAACDGTTGTTPTSTSDGQRKVVTMDMLKSMIPPQQPDGTNVVGLKTVREAMTDGVLNVPKGMVFKPDVCLNYLQDVLGPLDTLEGWVQYGTRRTTQMSPLFSTMVIKLPEGASIDRIRESAAKCATGGEMVLADKVSGTLTFTERKAPTFDDSKTFAMRQEVAFAQTSDPVQVATIEEFGFEAGHTCLTDASFLEMGNVLIWSLEPEARFTDQKFNQMHETMAQTLK